MEDIILKKETFVLIENFKSVSEQERKEKITKIMENIINNQYQQEQKQN